MVHSDSSAPTTVLTARMLLTLRTGTRLLVRLSANSALVEVEVIGNPTLVPRGKPGLNRIELFVIIPDVAARVYRSLGKHTAFGNSPFAMSKAKRVIRGDQVTVILDSK